MGSKLLQGNTGRPVCLCYIQCKFSTANSFFPEARIIFFLTPGKATAVSMGLLRSVSTSIWSANMTSFLCVLQLFCDVGLAQGLVPAQLHLRIIPSVKDHQSLNSKGLFFKEKVFGVRKCCEFVT